MRSKKTSAVKDPKFTFVTIKFTFYQKYLLVNFSVIIKELNINPVRLNRFNQIELVLPEVNNNHRHDDGKWSSKSYRHL